MFAALLVLAISCSVSLANISGTNPAAGTCLCFGGNNVNVRSSACGSSLGMVSSGRCFKAKGSKQTCSLNGRSYEFFRFDYGGRDGWAAGNFLRTASSSSCGGSSVSSYQPATTTNTEGYTCEIAHRGRKVHETLSATEHDCVDSKCENTCKGGQCVAYVTCSCKRNDRSPPRTACWRPGTKVVLSNGKCNRNIPINTAIATFNSNARYYAGHAAVFRGCADDYTIETYDQGCGKSIGPNSYGSSHSYYKNFAVITNENTVECSGRRSWPCRFENAGNTACSSFRSDKCKRRNYY